MRYAFQDDENCFFVLDLMLGGDLRCQSFLPTSCCLSSHSSKSTLNDLGLYQKKWSDFMSHKLPLHWPTYMKII